MAWLVLGTRSLYLYVFVYVFVLDNSPTRLKPPNQISPEFDVIKIDEISMCVSEFSTLNKSPPAGAQRVPSKGASWRDQQRLDETIHEAVDRSWVCFFVVFGGPSRAGSPCRFHGSWKKCRPERRLVFYRAVLFSWIWYCFFLYGIEWLPASGSLNSWTLHSSYRNIDCCEGS